MNRILILSLAVSQFETFTILNERLKIIFKDSKLTQKLLSGKKDLFWKKIDLMGHNSFTIKHIKP